MKRIACALTLILGCADDPAEREKDSAAPPAPVDASVDAALDARSEASIDAALAVDAGMVTADAGLAYDPRDPIIEIAAVTPESLATTTLPANAPGDLVMSATGGGCLNAATASEGAVVGVAVCRGSAGQRWKISERVLSLADAPTLCLDAASGRFKLSACASMNQNWTLADDGVIEKGNNAADYTSAGELISYGTHRGENQRWNLLSADLTRLKNTSVPSYPLAASNDAAYQLELVRHRVGAVQPPYPLLVERDVSKFPGGVGNSEGVSRRVFLDRRFDHDQDYLLVSWPNQHWQSTGLYAHAAKVIAVVVPQDADVKGLFVRLNVHTDRLSPTSGNVAGGKFERTPLVSLRLPLTAGVNLLRTPYGGEVVLESTLDTDTTLPIDIHGAVAMPRFVRGVTSAQSWLAQRAREAPWAELEGDRAVIHVPSEQIRGLDAPEVVMARYDRVAELEAELSGLDATSGVHRLYSGKARFVADIQITGGSGHSGYPIMAYLDWDFADAKSGGDDWGVWHELGHNHQQGCLWSSRFGGESTVNLFSLYVQRTLHDTSRVADQYDAVIAGLEQRTLTWESADVWQRLIFLAQPVNALPELGWKIYTRVMRAYRELPESERKAICADPQQQTDRFYVLLSRAAEVDLRDHFARWGITVSQSALEEVAGSGLKAPSVVVWRAR